MKKPLIAILCALILCLAAGPVPAESSRQSLRTFARYNLTEVFGYTHEEADAFVYEDNEKGLLRFWHRDHPEWVYTLGYDPASLQVTDGTSPFHLGLFHGFPGEAAIRDLLREAREQQWFTAWGPEAAAAFRQALLAGGNIRPTLSLEAGLAFGDISAAQAVEAFFNATLGLPHQRSPEGLAWQEAVMAEAGLQPEPPYLMPANRPFTRESQLNRSATFTRFEGQVPEMLQEAFSHPRLTGWTCLGGALVQTQTNEPGFVDTGMAAFEKDGQRLLVMLAGNPRQGWQVHPVDGASLRLGVDLTIRHSETNHSFRIAYAVSGEEVEVFTVRPAKSYNADALVCGLERYERFNTRTGHYFEALNINPGWELHESVSPYEKSWFTADAPVFSYMDAITDVSAFPTRLEDWQNASLTMIPEGYAMLAGVHLREKTSSRSKDLGLMNPGTLVKVLDTVPGDPFPWLHGQIGLKTGYMSTLYVSSTSGGEGSSAADILPLPAARAKKDIQLKAGTGLLDGKVMDLKAGSRMHVINEEGGWLYVVVPREHLSWLMDVEGTYGFVKAGDVDIRGTSIQLDWLD